MAAQRRWLSCRACREISEVIVDAPSYSCCPVCGAGPADVGVYWPVPGESLARRRAGLPTLYPQERGDWSRPKPIPE